MYVVHVVHVAYVVFALHVVHIVHVLHVVHVVHVAYVVFALHVVHVVHVLHVVHVEYITELTGRDGGGIFLFACFFELFINSVALHKTLSSWTQVVKNSTHTRVHVTPPVTHMLTILTFIHLWSSASEVEILFLGSTVRSFFIKSTAIKGTIIHKYIHMYTVGPLYKGHIGTSKFVHCREVVHSSEVKNVLAL